MQVARVTLWGELVGALAYDTDTHLSTFEYAPEWIDKGIEIAPVYLPTEQRKFQFPQLSSSTFLGLPGVFADSLMDGFGQTLLERWLNHQGKSIQSKNPLMLLQMVGQLGKGAIEYLPCQHPPLTTQPLEDIHPLAAAARSITANSMDFSTVNADAMEHLIQAGYGLSGSQPKAFFATHKNANTVITGLSEPDDDYHERMVKFGEPNDPLQSILVEFAYGLMAQACGIETSTAKIVANEDSHHLVSERFDRENGTKLHFLTFSGLAHADRLRTQPFGYEDVFATMRQLRLDRSQAEQMLRRMVFNVIACNHNDHTKSIGFLMNRTGNWKLAPAYGLTYSNGMGPQEQHQLSMNGKTGQLHRQDLISVVPSMQNEAQQIINEISERVAAWPMFARQAGVSRELMAKIQRHHLVTL